MRRSIIVLAVALLIQLLAVSALAQDKLAGRWTGKVKAPQGERDAEANFSKEGDKYTGKISGVRPGQDNTFKEVKVEGDNVTAVVEVETPQGMLVINYKFTVKGDTMTGQGSLDFNGNPFSFDYEFKRGGSATASSAAPAPAASQAQPGRPRSGPEQPQQKQSIDYFVGKWSFKVVGRESALGAAPREGFVTFTKRADGKSVEGVVEAVADGKPYKETITLTFDEASKMVTTSEKLATGIQVTGKGDWTSPISIRFAVDPIKVKGQSLQLRRTLAVVAAHSFTITEELSEDGGPFVRLGNGIYSKAQ